MRDVASLLLYQFFTILVDFSCSLGSILTYAGILHSCISSPTELSELIHPCQWHGTELLENASTSLQIFQDLSVQDLSGCVCTHLH